MPDYHPLLDYHPLITIVIPGDKPGLSADLEERLGRMGEELRVSYSKPYDPDRLSDADKRYFDVEQKAWIFLHRFLPWEKRRAVLGYVKRHIPEATVKVETVEYEVLGPTWEGIGPPISVRLADIFDLFKRKCNYFFNR